MPLTASTIDNLTVVTGTGGPTVIFQPEPGTVGRYRFRVVRFLLSGTVAAGDGVTIQGVSLKPDQTGMETQTLWQSNAPTAAPYNDQTTFPDEHEFRGKIQVTITSAAGTPILFLYHG
jgi:hypothetical protein